MDYFRFLLNIKVKNYSYSEVKQPSFCPCQTRLVSKKMPVTYPNQLIVAYFSCKLLLNDIHINEMIVLSSNLTFIFVVYYLFVFIDHKLF